MIESPRQAGAVREPRTARTRSPRRIALGEVLLRKGIQIIVGIRAVGAATRAFASKVKLSEKFPAPAQVLSGGPLVYAPAGGFPFQALNAFAKSGDFRLDGCGHLLISAMWPPLASPSVAE
jgi:hypothetical protein